MDPESGTLDGQYRITGSEFEIVEGLAVTEVACMPEAIMTTELR